MPMTLEMPADVETTSQNGQHAESAAADQAADLLDQAGGDDGGEPSELTDPDATDVPFDVTESTEGTGDGQQAVAESPVAEQPTEPDQPKKKRGRKKKGDAAATDATGTPAEQPLSPEVAQAHAETRAYANEQAVKVEMSRSTRLFQIAKVQAEYVEVCLRVNCIEAVIESAKKELKGLADQQAGLARDLMTLRNGDEYQPPLFDPPKPEVKSEPAGTEGDTSPSSVGQKLDADAPPAAAVDPNPDAWKSVSIDALNLPGKLGERLKEANAETIGRLENLRAEISQGREKWPKGIGKARITEIENCIIDWLSKNRDAAVLAQATGDSWPQPTQQQSAGNPVGEPENPVAIGNGSPRPAAVPSFDEWEALTEDQQQKYICARAAILNTNEENCLATKHPSGSQYWDSGFAAGQRGDKVSECGYVAGHEMDDWIRGWLAHGAVEKYEPTPKIKSAKKPVALASLDDL